MENYTEQYKQALKRAQECKNYVMDNVISYIKCISAKPVHIGNMVYFYTQYNGREVPAYCYERDYDENNPKFLPIYDEDNTGEFGWTDFVDCCRIFDVIKGALIKT